MIMRSIRELMAFRIRCFRRGKRRVTRDEFSTVVSTLFTTTSFRLWKEDEFSTENQLAHYGQIVREKVFQPASKLIGFP
jgi:hypothetical protein